jgi:NAD(P)-dependent dehydrogenase (short-subunit alcohol dehydrogenase family)
MKKIISVLLCVVMLLGMLPILPTSAEAEGADLSGIADGGKYVDAKGNEYTVLKSADTILNLVKADMSGNFILGNDIDFNNKRFYSYMFNNDGEAFSGVFSLNIMGALIPTQEFARDMAEAGSGCIINISSMNAFTPLTRIPAYSAAKSGVSNFTEWLAVHFAKTGIRCNAIAPGFFSTAQNAKLLWNEDGSPTARTEKILNATPMGRFGKPEELTGAMLFLCDEKCSGFMTGVVLPIDGGFNAYSGV